MISSLLDTLELKKGKNKDVSQYLRHGVMVKHNTLLHKVIDLLCAMMNPFDQADKKIFYNIATGKAVSVDTEQFLLNVNVRVEIGKKSFIRMHKKTREI